MNGEAKAGGEKTASFNTSHEGAEANFYGNGLAARVRRILSRTMEK